LNNDPSSLTVRFRGVRGSIPSPGKETARYGGNTSCVELRCEGHLLILDAGSGIRALGNELVAEAGDQPVCADILISHTHWDHIQGFPFFAPAYSDRNRIRVWESKQIESNLAMALRGQMQALHFPVSLDQMHGVTSFNQLNGEPTTVGPYLIRSAALNHPGGCAGFRVETTFGSLAYLPDHEPIAETNAQQRESLMEFVRGVDLLVLDTQYTEEEYSRHIGWGHGCLPHSVALAKDAQVRRLAFFHHDPSHRDYQIDLMVEAGRKLSTSADLEIIAATEMETIFLTATRSLPSNGQGMPSAGVLNSVTQTA
jgi:phosphoribosyl 1,2-cyclic phosphodiesterase